MKKLIFLICLVLLLLFSKTQNSNSQFGFDITDLTDVLNNQAVIDDTLSTAAHMLVDIQGHLHAVGRVFGKSGDQSGNNWATNGSHTPFTITSGNGAYGDTIKVIGSDDTPLFIGTGFDLRMFMVELVSVGTTYHIRFIWHTDNASLGVAANQFTETLFLFDTTNPNLAAGLPIVTLMPALPGGMKVCAQIANETISATANIVVILQPED